MCTKIKRKIKKSEKRDYKRFVAHMCARLTRAIVLDFMYIIIEIGFTLDSQGGTNSQINTATSSVI